MSRRFMKFIIKKTKNGGLRLGNIDFPKGGTSRVLDTPMCILYTRGGSVPHLTKDMLNRIEDLPAMANVSLNMMTDHRDALSDFGKGIAEFSAMQEFLMFSCTHDTCTVVPSGYNEHSGVAVWSKGGKIKFDVALFVAVQDALKPDMFEALADGDTTADSSKKRIGKSVNRTLNFLDEILEHQSKSERLKDAAVLGVLEGGHDVDERERSARETASRRVAGFVLDGLLSIGPSSENSSIELLEDLIRKTNACLPEDKPRMMHSIWRPDAVLLGVEYGLDIFDTSYPYIVANRGSSLIFDLDYNNLPEHIQNGSGEHQTKRSSRFEIDLNDKRYSDDFTPLLEGCTCYTCKNFTKAYVHHLLNTSELLSGVLLVLHNLHHYLKFFKTLRSSLMEDKYDVFRKLIMDQKSVFDTK